MLRDLNWLFSSNLALPLSFRIRRLLLGVYVSPVTNETEVMADFCSSNPARCAYMYDTNGFAFLWAVVMGDHLSR